MNNIFGVILSGGSGSRMKSAKPKQFARLRELSLLEHSVKSFNDWGFFKSIVVVSNLDYIVDTENSISKYLLANDRIVPGGVTRHESCLRGLEALHYDEKDIVIFHDSARPFFLKSELHSVANAAVMYGAASIADNVSETVVSCSDGRVEAILNRDEINLIKTPQALHTSLLNILLKEKLEEDPTDLCSWALQFGVKTFLIKSNPFNIKITREGDMEVAEKYYDLFRQLEPN
jgi:2-C-methyl-D-erythritol 4-phosphate cytidylyltransferase